MGSQQVEQPLTDDPKTAQSLDAPASPESEPEPVLFDLALLVEPQGISCRFACAGRTAQWTVPKTAVRRANKAITINHLFDILGAGPILGCLLHNAETNEPEFQMVPRAVNALTERVTKEIRLALKKSSAFKEDAEM